MNKTSYSVSSRALKRPESYRVVYKSRNNQLQQSSQLRNSSYIKQNQTSMSNHKTSLRESTKSVMKSFVKNRMKTQYNNNFRYSQIRKTKTPIQRKSQTTEPQKVKLNLQKFIQKTEDIKIQNKDQAKSVRNDTRRSKKPMDILQSVQKRMEALLTERLNQCESFKTQRKSIIQNELESLIQNIEQIKEGSNPEETDATDIEYCNKKIKMIERIMAESMTESQILKKYLLSQLSNKSKYRKINTEQSIFYNRPRTFKSEIFLQPEVVTKLSNNQESYIRPKKQAYNIYKYKNSFFNADRHKQPLPRSSYNRQFLKYDLNTEAGYIPVDNQFMGRKSISSRLFNTSYKQEFGPKTAQKINIKDLNAYINKITNIPIVFHNAKKDNPKDNLVYNIQKLNRITSKPVEPQLKMPKDYLLSESRRQYRGNSSFNNIKSQIKHSYLQKLRYLLKQNTHA